jgi:hypothetical protein
MKTFGSIEDVKRALPKEVANAFPERQRALETYFSAGGIVKLEFGRGFPELVYPTRSRLEGQLKETAEKASGFGKQLREWGKRRADLESDKVGDYVLRAADPVFWEHQAKLLSDPEYKEDYELISPPMHLLHRQEWKKRLAMFVRSKEYRLRLREARTSIIGKKRLPMSEEVEMRLDFNRQTADRELEKVAAKKKTLDSLESALRVMLAWTAR